MPTLLEALVPLVDLPFVFYGHSMGSLIALELAHELRARGHTLPLALFPAAHQAPQVPHEAAISELPDSEIVAHLKKLSDTPHLLEHPKLLRLILPTLRSDFSLCDTYKYEARPKLTCPITFFVGQDDEMSRDEIEGWGQETTGPFDVEILPGGHLFLMSSRQRLLEILSLKLSALAC